MFEVITGLIDRMGVIGVALMMFLENVFPPIPSELIMPLAGYLAAEGHLPLWGVLAAGTLGSILGAVVWYELGRALGEERFLALIDRFGLWATLSREDAEYALHWFRTKGGWAVLLGRMVPAVRTLISVPAGLAAMPRLPFLLLTALGSLIWIGFLTGAGYVLQAEYHRLAVWLDPGTTIVVAIVVLIYVYRLTRQLIRRRRGASGRGGRG